MTPAEIAVKVREALQNMRCAEGCYDPATMEYGPGYDACPRCALGELAAELEREAAA